MKFDQLMTSLKQGHYSSVYLLHGEEPYFIDQASGYIAEHCIDEASKDFNQTVMYAADVKDPGMLLETLKRYPMMAERQLVILKEAHQLKADYWEKLESYFNAPQDTTVFVIEHKYKKADARKRWTKAIGKNGVAFQSAKIYDNKLPDWIHNYLADRHYRIGQKGSHLIADFLGNDLSKIANELEKLFISLEPGATVTEEDIETHIGISKDFNIFELQNAIGDRDFAKAIRIARYFGQHQKDHPIFATIPVLLATSPS
jgi:DNA polymerase-3 subunit delta